jgi:hypothetical protein
LFNHTHWVTLVSRITHCITAKTTTQLGLILLLSIGFSGCNELKNTELKNTEQDAALVGLPRWVQGIFQLPLGSADGFAALKLDGIAPETTTTSLAPPPIPGVAIVSQLIRYAQQPNSPIEPYAYWLLLHGNQSSGTKTLTTPNSVLTGKGVWLLTLRNNDIQPLRTQLGFIAKNTNRSTPLWYQPQHQLWLASYPHQNGKLLLLASSEAGLTQSLQTLQQLKHSQTALKPEAKTKLIHGLETLLGSNTLTPSAESNKTTVVMGLPTNSKQWERLGLKQTLKQFKLPWKNKQQPINPLNNSWTLLTGFSNNNTTKHHQQTMQFVTPLLVTTTDKQYPNAQWFDFIFGVPKTTSLTVKTPVALSLSHMNETALAAIESDAFPQLNQQLGMIKPALGLLQLDFNRDILGLLAGETWVATPTPKESWLLLQKTASKQTSMDKWIGHLSGKSWLSKILFDGKLQQAPILEQKTLADGSGHFWAIHIPKQAKNLAKLPPLGLIETNHAFVVAPLSRLNQRGVLSTMNSLIEEHPTPALGFEPLFHVQADTTQPNGSWLIQQFTQKMNGFIKKQTGGTPLTNPPSTELSAGIITVDAGYQPSRGSIRGRILLDITEK